MAFHSMYIAMHWVVSTPYAIPCKEIEIPVSYVSSLDVYMSSKDTKGLYCTATQNLDVASGLTDWEKRSPCRWKRA